MAVQEAEALCQSHLEDFVVADVQPVMQTEERPRDQMMDQIQVGEVVHPASPRKLRHDGGREVPRVGSSPRNHVASV